MILIGLHGRARAGKDTVGQMLVMHHGCDRIALADPIKAMLIQGLGLRAEHFEGQLKEQVIPWLGRSPRQLMQTLGTEWGRDMVHPDLWKLVAGRDITASQTMGRSVVITDIRFTDEADWLLRQGGEIWHIIRHSDPVAPHKSEQGIHRDQITRTIDNTGSLDHTRRQVAAAYQAAALMVDPLDFMEGRG